MEPTKRGHWSGGASDRGAVGSEHKFLIPPSLTSFLLLAAASQTQPWTRRDVRGSPQGRGSVDEVDIMRFGGAGWCERVPVHDIASLLPGLICYSERPYL